MSASASVGACPLTAICDLALAVIVSIWVLALCNNRIRLRCHVGEWASERPLRIPEWWARVHLGRKCRCRLWRQVVEWALNSSRCDQSGCVRRCFWISSDNVRSPLVRFGFQFRRSLPRGLPRRTDCEVLSFETVCGSSRERCTDNQHNLRPENVWSSEPLERPLHWILCPCQRREKQIPYLYLWCPYKPFYQRHNLLAARPLWSGKVLQYVADMFCSVCKHIRAVFAAAGGGVVVLLGLMNKSYGLIGWSVKTWRWIRVSSASV